MLLHHGAIETYRDNTGRTAFQYAPEGAQVDEKKFGETREDDVDIEAVSKNEEVVNAIVRSLGRGQAFLPGAILLWPMAAAEDREGSWPVVVVPDMCTTHRPREDVLLHDDRFQVQLSRAAICRVETQRTASSVPNCRGRGRHALQRKKKTSFCCDSVRRREKHENTRYRLNRSLTDSLHVSARQIVRLGE